MAFPTIPEMRTRRELELSLRDALHAIALLLESDPTDPAYLAVSNQLAAIVRWTAGGANLTQAQKDRITMGLVAQREIMGDEPELAALLIGLHHHILRRMPTAEP